MSLEFIEIIERIVDQQIKYLSPRLGQVLKIDDDDQKGRILCTIPVLGWLDEESAILCYPVSNRSVITPEKDDYVIIIFPDGRIDGTALYLGIAYEMKEMLPTNFDGQATTKILYESKDLLILYDESANKYEISLNDNKITLDDENKKITIDDGGNSILMNKTTGEMVLENQSGKKIELLSSQVTITGTLGKLEVL